MLAKLIFVFALLAVALAAPQYYYPGSGYGYSGYSSSYPGYYGYSGYSPLSYSGYGAYPGSSYNYGYSYY
ncbi:prisilkin-39-like [Leguminivora glycinivorella]|uniref:prisilkin-39-like n=1 Tax=Leguminivora glycinivorella TaxID=1035111 RepID=UPI0020103454|nr:prisilkin-39-like [Leguminivora glycinivorella]